MSLVQSPVIHFSTKAQTLKSLFGVIKNAAISPLHIVRFADFKNNRSETIKKIQNHFRDDLLIVRSSSKNEDAADFSNAGHYESILNVDRCNDEELYSAISAVFSSYESNDDTNEVLIQGQLKDIIMSGVAFTCDLDTLTPYYIVNYDENGTSDGITSGRSENHKTYVHFKHAPKNAENEILKSLITALGELEVLFGHSFLDVEFAFNKNFELYIFQVRRIAAKNKEDLSSIDLKDPLLKLHKKITKLSSSHPNLLGDTAIYGVMPDWNPAEIIGVKPKNLAASLYKEIITDSIWAYQRDNYGYRNLRSHPLMLLFLGVPYIDVRVDFNSFIPKELNENIASKLVNFYLEKLKAQPVLHDKIEFEIVHSCYYFNLPEKLKELTSYGFDNSEIELIESSLLHLTNKIIDPINGFYKKDLLQIENLKDKYDKIVNSNLSIVDKIYWLMEDCKRYGTLPFAGIARSAFIATQILKSLVAKQIISEKEYNLFSSSLHTITKDLNSDLSNFKRGGLQKKELLEKYGHLRPGTYDIDSKRYDANFETYFNHEIEEKEHIQEEFKFSNEQLTVIDNLISKYHLSGNASDLIKFIKIAIEGREYSKFVFTRSLSKVLSLIEELAVKYNVNSNDLAHLDIKTILNLYASLDQRDVKKIFDADIELYKQSYEYTKAIKLPGLITDADDVYSYFVKSEEPNFITLKKVRSEIMFEESIGSQDPVGKIVFIRSADPGYDFLFSKNIGGLVTQYGGANSHMAVRCAELGIPAIIGAGEQNFNTWNKAKLLEIDCLTKNVRIIL